MSNEKIALYLRLSREDDERESESHSIANQRLFLQQFLDSKGWCLTDTYIDDGYSGTNFDRPGFLRMIGDIEANKINTVITKDLSRLGRDYIQTGYYLEQYFPLKRVRYIAVNDHIDTSESQGVDLLTPFLSVFNDMYAKDISRKVRTALTTRKAEGKFIGSTAPYGYEKHPEEKGRLVVDPIAAPVVKEIFQSFLESGSIIGIVKQLSEQKIETPSAYRHLTHTQKRFSGMWNESMVRRILTNPTYAGHVTQNRSKKINYKIDKKQTLPKEEWMIVRNTHEAIVSDRDFEEVQLRMRTRSYKTSKGNEHLLTGLAYCADCGSPMTYVRESETRTYMVCQGYRRGGRVKLCTSHCIREDSVIAAIQGALKEFTDTLPKKEEIFAGIHSPSNQKSVEAQIDQLKQEIDHNKRILLNLYKDKTNEVISEMDYREMARALKQERNEMEEHLEAYYKLSRRDDSDEVMRDQIQEFMGFHKLDRLTVVALVERIEIDRDKNIEIQFKFKKP